MPRLVLHVGLPKSGTTYLQSRLVRNADDLADRGVLVPVAPTEDGRGSVAFRAALDLTSRRLGRPQEYVEGRWAALVGAVGEHAGPVVVSHEAFVRCTPEQATRAVTDLGRRHEVHVVVTARDPARLLVSAWLEGLKHGTAHDLDEHLRLAQVGSLPVWRTLDLPAVLGTWLGVLGPGRVHLVTVPPRGGDRRALWPRFCSVAGVGLETAGIEPRRTNESLGVPEAQLMLAVNRLLVGDVGRGGRHHRSVSRVLARRLAARTSVPVDPTGAVVAWAAGVADDWLRWLAEHPVDLTGARDDLVPGPADPTGRADPALPHTDVVHAAAEAIAVLLEAVPVSNPGRGGLDLGDRVQA